MGSISVGVYIFLIATLLITNCFLKHCKTFRKSKKKTTRRRNIFELQDVSYPLERPEERQSSIPSENAPSLPPPTNEQRDDDFSDDVFFPETESHYSTVGQSGGGADAVVNLAIVRAVQSPDNQGNVFVFPEVHADEAHVSEEINV